MQINYISQKAKYNSVLIQWPDFFLLICNETRNWEKKKFYVNVKPFIPFL